MFTGKPIIGIAGGIGSGKSFIADLFGEFGCCVIHADQQVHEAYLRPDVRQTIRSWWGDSVFRPDGQVDRKAIAARFLGDAAERKRLENLLHPIVAGQRLEIMKRAADDAQAVAFVWDTPLLFETNLHGQCDTVVFVQSPAYLRLKRVNDQRGWDRAELDRRENLQ